jgi:hypothetical protein
MWRNIASIIDQRLFNSARIAAKIMAGHHLRLHSTLMEESPESSSNDSYAVEIELLFEHPAGIIFAKVGWLDERKALKFDGIGRNRYRNECSCGTFRK